jgi:hypothetical protein
MAVFCWIWFVSDVKRIISFSFHGRFSPLPQIRFVSAHTLSSMTGFPAALFTFVFPNFVSQGVFALTFPLVRASFAPFMQFCGFESSDAHRPHDSYSPTTPQFIVLAIVSRPVEHYRVVAAKTAAPSNGDVAEPLPTSSVSSANSTATALANASFPHRMPIFREARIVNRVALRACGSCRARRTSAPLATTGSNSAAAAASLASNRTSK